MKQFLSPKQAAQSLGVSESSLKRWCDRGTLQMHLTAGGHRKIPVTAVVQFVRKNRRELMRPELLGLPARRVTDEQDLANSVEPLAATFVSGESESSRQLVFGHYLKGHCVAKICDELLAPALMLIGERWRTGELEIYEEHQTVQATHQLLSALQATIPSAKRNAPIAIGGTAEHDIYGLPTRMIELSLIEAGWNATSLGTSLPFSTLHAAVRKYEPKLVWLSISVLRDPIPFAVKLDSFARELGKATKLFVGGRAVPMNTTTLGDSIVHCMRIQELVSASKQLMPTTLVKEGVLR